MPLEEIKGVSISAEEKQKVTDALAALSKDPHAPRELGVRVTLHVHHEYPKHITLGKDEANKPIVKIANSAQEEESLRAEFAPEPAD